MAIQAPWAILLCRYSDDNNDPDKTRVSDLYRQWGISRGTNWLLANVTNKAEVDNRTILDLYQTFFTITGVFTFNMVRYFDENSHGLLDITGSTVFPCLIDLTSAQSGALALSPGGIAHQNDLFQRAKKALLDQHGVDWKDYYGVVVSFQSPDEGGSQGGEFDGGPGVIGDVRWVRTGGTAKWGHEMGHGFGLQHSRTDGQLTSACTGGDPSDYTDDWDVMSFACDLNFEDLSYGLCGPGINAWNMRSRGWLDESRIWKAPSGIDFSQRIDLHPLHRRTDQGYLGAELPGIGGDSAYLVEARTPQEWDAAFATSLVVVHRFQAPNSYVMKGTAGQKILTAGGVFEKGDGPFSRLKVESIDQKTGIASVALCYSSGPKTLPKVKLARAGGSKGAYVDHCHPGNIAGTAVWFDFHLYGGCLANYTVQWMVQGAAITSAITPTTGLVQLLLPPAGQQVLVTVKITFDDGVSVFDSVSFQTISPEQAIWVSLFCRLRDEGRTKPIPWYKWDPELLRPFADLSKRELQTMLSRIEGIAKTLEHLKNSGG